MPAVAGFFPFWEKLSAEHREDLEAHAQPRLFKKGEVIHPYRGECLGLILVRQGRFRAFVLSESGKEVTLYRLFDGDTCLFSASCIMKNIQFDIHIQAERDTQVWLVPSALFDRLMNQSLEMANHAGRLMSSRFSDVMWTLEQVLFKSMDCRIAQYLLEQVNIEGSPRLALTHEVIARDLCTAREVVTRMLKYFGDDGLLALGRGKIEVLDEARLRALAG